MFNSLWRKGLVIGILLLFIGVSSTPSISINVIDKKVISNNISKSSYDIDWWPMFGHDLNHTGFSSSPIDDYLSLIWELDDFSTYRTTALAVVDGRIYLSSGVNVSCLSASDGEVLWSYEIDASYGSPTVYNNKVFIGSDDGRLYCLDAIDGSLIWFYYFVEDEIWTSPAVIDGKVFSSIDGNRMCCINSENGELIWSYWAGDFIQSSPVVANERIYFGSNDNRIYCLNTLDGELIWSYETGHQIKGSPSIFDGKVYIGSKDHYIYCLNADDGELIWSFDTGFWLLSSSPAIAYSKVYIGGTNGILYCLDAYDGEMIWSFGARGGIDGAPAIADGKLFFGSRDDDDGRFYCLNATDGSLIWYDFYPYWAICSPAIADGEIYMADTGGRLYKYGVDVEDPICEIGLKNNTIYLFGTEFSSPFNIIDILPIVIGKKTIVVYGDDNGFAEMDRCDFYINGELVHTDSDYLFEWECAEIKFPYEIMSLEVIVYDKAGNNNSDEISFLKIF